MKRNLLPLLACVWLCYGFSLNPNTWLRDLGLVSERITPRYTDIQFWDPERQEERAIRAFFYTTLPDKQNRILDERLHEHMTQYLSMICGEVITIDAFSDSTEKRIVENAMLSLMDEWRISGRIDPDNFFGQLPFLNVDLVIFMERTAYEPVWRDYDKMLVLGFHLAALELDLGEPIFAERFRTEIPWTGKSTSHVLAEKKALLQAADAMGSQFSQVAEMINQLRLREMQAEFMRIRAEEREAEERARQEQRLAAEMLRNAERVMRRRQAPLEMLDALQAKVDAIGPLVRTRELPPEQSELRRQLTAEIAVLLEQAEAAMAPHPEMLETPSAPFEQVIPDERAPVPPSLFGEIRREMTPEAPAPSPAEEPRSPLDWFRGAPLGVDLPDERAPNAPAPERERVQTVPSLDAPLDDPFNRRWLLPRD